MCPCALLFQYLSLLSDTKLHEFRIKRVFFLFPIPSIMPGTKQAHDKYLFNLVGFGNLNFDNIFLFLENMTNKIFTKSLLSFLNELIWLKRQEITLGKQYDIYFNSHFNFIRIIPSFPRKLAKYYQIVTSLPEIIYILKSHWLQK